MYEVRSYTGRRLIDAAGKDIGREVERLGYFQEHAQAQRVAKAHEASGKTVEIVERPGSLDAIWVEFPNRE